jgi:Beta-L-arabinofuranosidase, GH127 catalytic domain
MTQVRLLPNSLFHDALEWNRSYMSRLAANRLLYTFRVNAGLPVGSAKPLGGWEQPENGLRSSELRSHFCGHFLSANALLYASTGDTGAKAKADSIVAELVRCQQRLGGMYLSAFPATWFDRLEKGERVWAPFYTIHKIMAGLFDVYRLAGNSQALQVLERMAASARSSPRRARRTAREYAHPAGHCRSPSLRDLGRYALSRCRRLLFLRGQHGAVVRHRRNEQRRGMARRAAPACGGTERQREHRRMLLRLQHAEARTTHLRLDRRPARVRLLRALAAESSDRHDPAEGRDDAVLPVIDAGCLEDVRY